MPGLRRAEGAVDDQHPQGEGRELHEAICQAGVERSSMCHAPQQCWREVQLLPQRRVAALHHRVVDAVPEVVGAAVRDNKELTCSGGGAPLPPELTASQNQGVRDILCMREGSDVLALAEYPQLAGGGCLQHARQEELVLGGVDLVWGHCARCDLAPRLCSAAIALQDVLLPEGFGGGVLVDGVLVGHLVLHEPFYITCGWVSRRRGRAVDKDQVASLAAAMLRKGIQDVLSTNVVDRIVQLSLVEGADQRGKVEDHLYVLEGARTGATLCSRHGLHVRDVRLHVGQFRAELLSHVL
mmetsp:Transcript_42161/g.98881  ORF Transcript_42161/g.98881 Transcript_42161/m.98881 type:complete len:297 (+) Transcript_42161:176-1066(+)